MFMIKNQQIAINFVCKFFLAPGIDADDRAMVDPWQSWRNVESPRPKEEVSQSTKTKAG
jgi:hypothetical protein